MIPAHVGGRREGGQRAGSSSRPPEGVEVGSEGSLQDQWPVLAKGEREAGERWGPILDPGSCPGLVPHRV